MSKPMMQTVVVDTLATPVKVRLHTQLLRKPKPNEVVVKVAAAALNPIDIATATGIATDGKIYPDLRPAFPLSLGWDMVGTIKQVGNAVQKWRVGDAVLAMVHQIASGFGAQGTYVVLSTELLAPWPTVIPAAKMATLPLAGLTAYQAIKALRLKQGDHLLINGPLGAIGSIASQLAVRAGAQVVGVVRKGEEEIAARFSVTEYIERGTDIHAMAKRLPYGIDAALDVVGGETALQTIAAVRENGRYVTLIPHIGQGLPTPQRGIVQQNVLIVPDSAELNELAQLVASGQLILNDPITVPLSDPQRAYDLMVSGHVRRRVVYEN